MQSPLQRLQATLQDLAKEESSSPQAQELVESLRVCNEAIQETPPLTDQMYKIRNLDTGEEVDLRDENKHSFVERLMKLVRTANYKGALEAF